MHHREKKSTFLIQSSKNSSFGTGFMIYRDSNISYILTCAHVIDSCDRDEIIVDGKKATLVAIGSTDNIDLAVISIKELDGTPLRLVSTSPHNGMRFKIEGYKPYRNQNYKLELLEGSIEKESEIKTDKQAINIYELSFDLRDDIEKGYSGSAVVCNDYVVGVAISRYSSKHADAIDIGYLQEIWQDMPPKLLMNISIEDKKEKSSPVKQLFNRRNLIYLIVLVLFMGAARLINCQLEEQKLSTLQSKIIGLYGKWEGVYRYKDNSKEKASIEKRASDLAKRIIYEISEDSLLFIESKILRYERASYAYAIASDMSSNSKKRIEFAKKNISMGEKAIKLIKEADGNRWIVEEDVENRVKLIISIGYIIQVEEGDSSLLNDAKEHFNEIESWYSSDLHPNNRLEVVERFIKSISND